MSAPRPLVIGGGVMGLAAAWALTRRGQRPLVVERFERGHSRGASHGATRNYNNAYTEPHYLDLLVRSRAGWDALGDVDGAPLLRLHGLVTHGSRPGDTARPGLAEVARRLTERGIPADLLSGAEAGRRWPGMRFEESVLFSPGGGVVRADAAISELERRIVAAGGEVRWNTPITRLVDDDGVVALTASGERLEADLAVVTVGAWTRRLLPDVPAPPLRVTEESPAHFAALAPVWPSFNHILDPALWPGNVYGMPTPGEGVKVGFHKVGDEVDPDDRPYRPTRQRELVEYVHEWFPGLDADAAVPISCTYTSTPDDAFVLDRTGNIVVGAGFSGQGFKFATGVGEVLADLAEGRDAPAPFRFR